MSQTEKTNKFARVEKSINDIYNNLNSKVIPLANNYLEKTTNLAELIRVQNERLSREITFGNDTESNTSIELSSISLQSRELNLDLNRWSQMNSSPLFMADRSVFEIMNKELHSDIDDITKFENLNTIVSKLNISLEYWLKMLNDKLKVFLVRFLQNFSADTGVFKFNVSSNTYTLMNLQQMISKQYHAENNYLNIYLSCVNVASCGQNSNYTQSKKAYVDELKKRVDVSPEYRTFWESLNVSKAHSILSNYTMPKKSIIQSQCTLLVEKIKYILGFKKYVNDLALNLTTDPSVPPPPDAPAPSFDFIFIDSEVISTDEVFKEFYDICGGNPEKYVTLEDINKFPTNDYLTLPASEFNPFFDLTDNNMSASGKSIYGSDEDDGDDDDDDDDEEKYIKSKKIKLSDFAQHPAPLAKLVEHKPYHVNVINFGRTDDEQKLYDKKVMKHLNEYSENMIKLFGPYFKLVDVSGMNLFMSNYNLYPSISTDGKKFTSFVTEIKYSHHLYSLLGLLFDEKTVQYMDTNYLTHLFQDMAKCVVICGYATNLSKNIGENDNIDFNECTLKEFLIDNSKELFPVNLTIRETPILSNYYGNVYKKPQFKLPSLAKFWIQDSILLSTHMSCLMLFIYFRFLEFLISVGTNNSQIFSLFDDSTSFENIVLDNKNYNISEINIEQTVTMNNGGIRKLKKINNLYLLAYKYLTGNTSVTEGEILEDGDRMELCTMVLCKILDYLYRSLKLTSKCFKEMKSMSSTSFNQSFLSELQEAGQVYEIKSIIMFEQYLVDIVVAMNMRIQSIIPFIFNRLEESHDSNMLIIGPEFLLTMALVINNKITIQDAVQNRTNFYNLTRNMLYVFYKTFTDLFSVEDPQFDAPSNCTDGLSYSGKGYDDDDTSEYETDILGGANKHKRKLKIEKLRENCDFAKPKNSMYNYIPSIDDYMLYYKKLSNQIGSDIAKFDLEKFQACPQFDSLPFEISMNTFDNKNELEKKDYDDEKSIKSYFELITTLSNINNNLELFNNTLFKIGNILSAIVDTMSNNYYFYLLENVAIQHFYKRPVYYLFNDINSFEISNTKLNLEHLFLIGFEYGAPYINTEKLVYCIKNETDVIDFFNKKKYLQSLRLFILKRFSSITNDNKYFFIFKPIHLSKLCPNFYLGILIVYLWHCIYNVQLVSDKMI